MRVFLRRFFSVRLFKERSTACCKGSQRNEVPAAVFLRESDVRALSEVSRRLRFRSWVSVECKLTRASFVLASLLDSVGQVGHKMNAVA